jgi:hypothetical protein
VLEAGISGRRPELEILEQKVLLDVREQENQGADLLAIPARRERSERALIVLGRQTDLLEVVAATHAVGRFADLLDGGEQEADQHGNDGDDHQQLDQRKSRATMESDHVVLLKREERNRR